MTDTDDDPFEESPAAKAFDEAQRGFELFGKPLHDYSPSRMVAAQKMGMRYPFIGEKAAEIFEETGMYPNGIEDCIILLWLCSIKDKDIERKKEAWTPDRAGSKPAIAKQIAMEWADKEGFARPMVNEAVNPKFQEAFKTFQAIAVGQEASKFRVSAGDQSEDDSEKI